MHVRSALIATLVRRERRVIDSSPSVADPYAHHHHHHHPHHYHHRHLHHRHHQQHFVACIGLSSLVRALFDQSILARYHPYDRTTPANDTRPSLHRDSVPSRAPCYKSVPAMRVARVHPSSNVRHRRCQTIAPRHAIDRDINATVAERVRSCSVVRPWYVLAQTMPDHHFFATLYVPLPPPNALSAPRSISRVVVPNLFFSCEPQTLCAAADPQSSANVLRRPRSAVYVSCVAVADCFQRLHYRHCHHHHHHHRVLVCECILFFACALFYPFWFWFWF
mmetsp:Transcript_19588/g.31142  ORF Transcript_19588/g.31142 Transcript_19588/m.31142 type:complete len:278 (+) Transcript_19588:162-995(+)